MNATRRRIVASFTRTQEANRAKRRCGRSVERSRRRPNREKERFLKKRTEKPRASEPARQKGVFHIPRAKESNRIKETGARSPPLLFQQRRSILSLKKKKEKKKNSREIRRSQTLRSKTIVRFKDRSKGGKICESKKKKKRGREIRQSAERKVRYYPGWQVDASQSSFPYRISLKRYTIRGSWSRSSEATIADRRTRFWNSTPESILQCTRVHRRRKRRKWGVEGRKQGISIGQV